MKIVVSKDAKALGANAAEYIAELINEAIAKKAELITCNNPDVVLECLRKRGAHK